MRFNPAGPSDKACRSVVGAQGVFGLEYPPLPMRRTRTPGLESHAPAALETETGRREPKGASLRPFEQ